MSTSADRLRRTGVLALALLCLLLAPQVAAARFSGTSDAALRVGTATLVAPADLSGSYRCSLGVLTESVEVTVDGFTDSGPAGVSYAYSLLRGGAVRAGATSTARAQRLAATAFIDGVATRWEVTVTSRLAGWTSPAGRVTITCPFGGIGSGTF